MRRSRMSWTATTPANAPSAVPEHARRRVEPAVHAVTLARRGALTPTAQSVACRTRRSSSSTRPPVAGRAARLVPWLRERLERRPDAELRVTARAGEAEELAAAAVGDGRERVVAVGGDGTVQEVVNGLLAANGPARLGVVPVGTGNDLARSLGLPRRSGGGVDGRASADATRRSTPRARRNGDGRRALVRVGRRHRLRRPGGGRHGGASRMAGGPRRLPAHHTGRAAPLREPPRASHDRRRGRRSRRSSSSRSPTARTTAAACGSRPVPEPTTDASTSASSATSRA